MPTLIKSNAGISSYFINSKEWTNLIYDNFKANTRLKNWGIKILIDAFLDNDGKTYVTGQVFALNFICEILTIGNDLLSEFRLGRYTKHKDKPRYWNQSLAVDVNSSEIFNALSKIQVKPLKERDILIDRLMLTLEDNTNQEIKCRIFGNQSDTKIVSSPHLDVSCISTN